MGDKGGKKDKKKNKQQQLTKQRQEEQRKHDQGPGKNSVAGSAQGDRGRGERPV
jgi:hypothetical protein